jgi:hypothetical protein
VGNNNHLKHNNNWPNKEHLFFEASQEGEDEEGTKETDLAIIKPLSGIIGYSTR